VNIVGITTKRASILEPKGKWFEAIDPKQLEPQNLWRAHLARRLGK